MGKVRKGTGGTTAKKCAFYGILAGLAMILSYLESCLPSFGIPGIKPGLANVVSMTVLTLQGPAAAATVSLVRILMTGILFGNAVSMLYSIAGAVCSLSVMVLLRKTSHFSLPAMSAAGGAAHELGQLAVAFLMAGKGVLVWLPVLLLSGTVFGILTGTVTAAVLKRLYQKGDL